MDKKDFQNYYVGDDEDDEEKVAEKFRPFAKILDKIEKGKQKEKFLGYDYYYSTRKTLSHQ